MGTHDDVEPLVLTGHHVQLEPLTLDHVHQLVVAANEDRTTYAWTSVPSSVNGMTRYVAGLVEDAEEGRVIPFVQRRLSDQRVVGCTRFMELRRWSGRVDPDEVEIGGTWLALAAQRSAINSEAKLLLLSHAFETWQVERVAICTDARNAQSRTAIERLGATFEGILRNHRASVVEGEAGRPRASALYSITGDEWPSVRDALRTRLG